MKKLSEFVTKNKIKVGVLLLCFIVLIVACIYYANNKQIATMTTPEEEKIKAQLNTVPEGYTAITTKEQLAAIKDDLSGKYILMADLDMTDVAFEPIGQTSSASFKGTFDGNYHKISNLKIESSSQYVGMFGYINGGTIKNLLLENVNIKGTNTYVGGLAGNNYSGTITNVGITGEVTSTNNYVGGLIGNNNGTITNAYSTATVSGGTSNVGGLVGNNYSGNITNSYAVGKVTATGTSNIGGLVGYNRSGATVNNSYWAVDTTGQTMSAAGEGRFLSVMLKSATFKTWDFDTIWQIEGGNTLPYLKGMAKPTGVNKTSYTYTEWEGEGTEESPYLVKTDEHLRGINNILDAHYKLANDIDMTEEEFETIGQTLSTPFVGIFDGNNHKISNLKIESDNQYVGMFGYVNGGIIKNLKLENVNVKGTNTSSNAYVGGLVGYSNAKTGTISNVYITGEVTSTKNYVGGLIGTNNGIITNVFSNTKVTGTSYIGGLAGKNSGTISNAYVTGEVIGTGSYIGGLVGENYNGTITNSYAVGKVTGTSYVGGLVGYRTATVSNSYWAIDTTAQATSAAGEGRFFSSMLKSATFKTWDFETVWQIEEGATLPYLKGMAKPEAVKATNYEYIDIEGAGLDTDPYLIKNPEQLKAVNKLLNAHYKLANDIDMKDEEFEIIGQTSSTPFIGTFDGNNHKIINLKIESENQYVGMFGYISGGTIKNLALENVSITGTNSSSSTYVGGLASSNYNGTITNVYVTGQVTGEGWNVGGLLGYNSGTVTNAYSTAIVSGGTYVGGLVGQNYSKSITNAYAIGTVTGRSNVGGLVGYNRSGATVNNSYWAFDTTKQGISGGGYGQFFSNMLKQATFKTWNFETVWQIEEGDTLPYLVGMAKPEAVKKENNEYVEWEGEGTEENPYLIKTPEQLNTVYYVLNAHYKLENDIDMSDINYNIIGQTDKTPFTGTFDGNGYTINNLTIESTNSCIGMFGYINGGSIKHLGLENVNVKRKETYYPDYTGGLVGYNKGTITDSHIVGTVSGVENVGGLVGDNNGTITNSYGKVTVIGTSNYIGGLVGVNNGIINSSYTTGVVTGTSNVGGLVGSNNSGKTITNSYSTAKVAGTSFYRGGLVGSNRGTITNAYATGEVQGTGNTGGLVGSNNGTAVSSYWAMDTTSQATSAVGEGKFFNAMLKQSTYINWDFENVWSIEEGDTLPYLVGMEKPEEVKAQNYEYIVWEGEGTSENPYLIKTPKELRAINYTSLSAHYKLANDIEMKDEEFKIIGQTLSEPFTGTFDGNGHKISNLKIESTNQFVGMFGYIKGGTVKNLALENININSISSYPEIGGIVGRVTEGIIENNSISGMITSNSVKTGNLKCIGGIVGIAADKNTLISKCYSNIEINAKVTNTTNAQISVGNYVGGVVGHGLRYNR